MHIIQRGLTTARNNRVGIFIGCGIGCGELRLLRRTGGPLDGHWGCCLKNWRCASVANDAVPNPVYYSTYCTAYQRNPLNAYR
jgi:hypothetical protein